MVRNGAIQTGSYPAASWPFDSSTGERSGELIDSGTRETNTRIGSGNPALCSYHGALRGHGEEPADRSRCSRQRSSWSCAAQTPGGLWRHRSLELFHFPWREKTPRRPSPGDNPAEENGEDPAPPTIRPAANYTK